MHDEFCRVGGMVWAQALGWSRSDHRDRDEAGLKEWVEHLDAEGVTHSPIIDATISWLVALRDPDGHEIHVMTSETHGIDQSGRPGYGRLVPGAQFPGRDIR